MKQSQGQSAGARAQNAARWRALRLVLVALAALAVVGGIPGSAMLRPLLFVRTAPPLPPDTRDRDAALAVHARDEAGVAIAGAEVHVFAMREEDGVRAYLAGQARTDGAGNAAIGALPRGEAWVVADAKGRARASSSLVLVAGKRDVEMVLGEEHRLDVDVKDERGDAVAGAEIEIAAGDPLPIGARAGEDGVAHVGRLGKGPWMVTARAPGYEEVAYRGVREGAPLHATLRKLGAIAVRVVSSDARDAPVAHARVQIASAALWPARVAETKDDGTVRIGGLSAGSYALRAVHGERASPIELGVTLARGEEKSLTLHLGPGVSVAVRVVDSEADDALPIAGARVTLAESGLSPFPIEGTTDKQGRARLGPIAAGEATIAARAEGYVARGALPVPEPPPAEMRVVLARAGAIEGRVVDARGFPIDGATIEIVGTDFYGAPIDDDPRRARFRDAHFEAALAGPSPLVPAGELGVMPGPVPPIPHGQSLSLLPPAMGTTAVLDEPWVTRDDGTYRAAPVSPGRVRALVRHAQYVEALSDVVTLAPDATAHIDVVMHAGGVLEGHVVDNAGKAVEGARVTMAASRGAMERTAQTASDGSFGFAAVPESVTLLVARDSDFAQVEARAVVTIPEGGTKSVTITLPDARPPLPVTVKDDRGYALELVQLGAVSLDPSSALRATAYTDARGEAQIGSAKGLPLRIEARAPGRATKVVTTDASIASLAIVLAAAESARGEVRDARSGQAIADAEVVLYTNAGALHARTEEDGAFHFDDLAAGDARLQVRAAGYVGVTRAIAIPVSDLHRPYDVPRIELAAGGGVEGLVLDARGDPVPGARVANDHVPTYLPMGAPPAGVAVADGKGRFALADLPEGTLTLEAYAPDVGRTREGDVRVVAGRVTRDVRITLRPSDDERATESAASGGVAVTLGETTEPREVVLVSVAPSSEAERAGLAPGDVVTEIDGVAVHTIAEARARLSGPLADDVLVKLRRGERVEAVRVAREQVRR